VDASCRPQRSRAGEKPPASAVLGFVASRDAVSFGSPKHRAAVNGSSGTAQAPASAGPADLVRDKAVADAARDFLQAVHDADREAERRPAA
jgi:hypothetical protein